MESPFSGITFYQLGCRDALLSVLAKARSESPESAVRSIARELHDGNYADNPHVKHWVAASPTQEKP